MTNYIELFLVACVQACMCICAIN